MATTATSAHVFDNFHSSYPDKGISSSSSSTYTVMDEYELYEQGFPLHNKYNYIKLLQTGSFGKVTLAIDTTTQTQYAVKSMYKKQSAMFRHETNVMKRLGRHPNLVQLVEHFDTTKYYVLILEYCDDGDLYDKIEELTLLSNTPIFALHLVRQMITSMKYVHSQNIYHRDFKPENILLMKNGDLKLCDFGLSTRLQFPNEMNVGTEKYMAPECINERDYDAKYADYWSFGITLCFLLFGKCPFKKASLDDDHFISYINNPQWLLSYYNNMSLKTFKLVSHLLSLSPKDRDLDRFESDFIEATKSGLTIDQEQELSTTPNIEGFVFNMDDDGDQQDDPFNMAIHMGDDDNDDLFGFEDMKDNQITQITQDTLSLINIPPPSLINSHMNSFSWADDDDFELRFNQPHLTYINDDTFNVDK